MRAANAEQPPEARRAPFPRGSTAHKGAVAVRSLGGKKSQPSFRDLFCFLGDGEKGSRGQTFDMTHMSAVDAKGCGFLVGREASATPAWRVSGAARE